MHNPLDRKKCKRAAIVLADGDGAHLHKLMDSTTWHSVPKQFCTLTGDETLLEQTVHRVARIVPQRKVAIVVNRAHREFYEGLSGVPASSIVAQPSNRGTVPAILYGLRRLANLGRNTIVAVFPCDHGLGSDDRFIRHIKEAISAVEVSSSLSIVLGVAPTTAESSFGWIEPGERVDPLDPSIFHIRRFWQKPRTELAAKLMLEGCLWNSLVLVARAPRLQEMIAECVPTLYVAFNVAFASHNDDYSKWIAVEELYRNMGTYGFSQKVISRCPPDLAVKCIDNVERNDLGEVNPLRTLGEPPFLTREFTRYSGPSDIRMISGVSHG
jgi:mannose-1-phosphate guanylyltransferase